MRLIDADALKEKAFGKRGGLIHTSDIDAAPTVETERKTGEWIDFAVSIKGVPTEACGECGEWSLGMGKHFCPNCGADMRPEARNG